MLSDLRFALRQLAKAPGFTATVVITLALGISACVTIFALVDSVLLRTYATYAGRCVAFGRTRPPNTIPLETSRRDWVAMTSELKSFELLHADWNNLATLTGEGEPMFVTGSCVTQHYFTFNGNRFITGRGFSAEELAAERAGVVILAQGFWQRAFGGRSDIVDRTVQLNGVPCTVVGVVSDGLASATGSIEVFSPGYIDPASGPGTSSGGAIRARGRLKPGVSLTEAQAELDVLAARLIRQYPETNSGFSSFVVPMSDFATRDSRPMLLTLFGSVICVLLIVCANIASMQLLRATIRQRELSLRAALGASRPRIVRQLLTESLLLALAGGGVGVMLALWTGDALRAYGSIPGIGTAGVEMDGRLIVFAIGLSVLTALFFGLAPAWLSSKVDLNEALKQGARGSTEGGARSRVRQTFVIFQVAIATILLGAAGLFIRSFLQLAKVDLGLLPQNAFTMSLAPLAKDRYATDEQRMAFVGAVLEKIRSLPGVEAAGVTQFVPFASGNINTSTFQIDGRPIETPGTEPRARSALVSPGYFAAAGIPLLRGRNFSEQDDLRSPRVALINDTFARQHFAGENPLGRRLLAYTFRRLPEWCEIVGVVADATQASPEQPITAHIYRAFGQQPPRDTVFHLIVRSARDSTELGRAVKAQVQAVDPNQPTGPITPLQETLDLRIRNRRFQLHLLSVFSFLALAISTVGIYGLMSYSVSQRTTEIGIRLALGAQSTDVARLILLQGARLTGIGLLVGLVGSLIVGHIIQARLFQVTAWDPATLLLTGVTIASVDLAACLIPTRRATKVDPIVALRAE